MTYGANCVQRPSHMREMTSLGEYSSRDMNGEDSVQDISLGTIPDFGC